MTTCLFCKIANSEAPAQIIYEDEHLIAFNDIHPQAPHHKIIIPRKHIPTLNDIDPSDSYLIGCMTLAAAHLAKTLNIADHGYRVVMNCNAGGGQTVFHVHMHVIGGRSMTWPPG